MKDVKIEFRKPIYPVSDELNHYLEKYHRTTKASIEYDDLMRFSGCVALEDKEGNDTHWLGVYYTDSEHQEIQDSLNRIYTYLHSDGDEESLPYLVVDSIDYCTFGNSKPFRIRVRNTLSIDEFTKKRIWSSGMANDLPKNSITNGFHRGHRKKWSPVCLGLGRNLRPEWCCCHVLILPYH